MTAKNVCMQTNENATKILEEVVNKYDFPFKEATLEFVPLRDMKIKWTRSYNWINFSFSDYLKDASDEIIEDVCRTLLEKISGRAPGTNSVYGDVTTKWLSSPDFVHAHQNTYISRCREFNGNPAGKVHNLNDSLDRLVKKGLIEADEDVVLGWMPMSSYHIGFSSILMKTVILNTKLDSVDIDQETFDFCVFCELCHIAMGFDPTTDYRGDILAEMIQEYPDCDEINSYLHSLGFLTYD